MFLGQLTSKSECFQEGFELRVLGEPCKLSRPKLAHMCLYGQESAHTDAFKAVTLSDDGRNKWQVMSFNLFTK